jgi:hypothetical protein
MRLRDMWGENDADEVEISPIRDEDLEECALVI